MKDTPVKLKQTIYQHASFSLPLVRRYLPFKAIATGCGDVLNACTGEPVEASDYEDEDYTGCTARMVARTDIGSAAVLFEASTDAGTITLAGNLLQVDLDAATTAALDFEQAIGHIEVTRPDGQVQRQYAIDFKFSKAVAL